MNTRIAVPYFAQDTNYTCGPASLQMVFAYFKIRESEAALAKELRTNTDIGTRHQRLIHAVTRRGLYAYVNANAPIEEIVSLIQKGCPVIVHYREVDMDDGHYAVVVGMSDTDIYLNDPWHGESFALPRGEFEERWLCGPEGTCERWLMAVSDKPFATGRQYRPTQS